MATDTQLDYYEHIEQVKRYIRLRVAWCLSLCGLCRRFQL